MVCNMHCDVAVVGAGPAGLTVGGILAKRGRRVIVWEKARAVGGRSMVVERDGFTLDYGIHYVRFGEHGRMAAAMRAMGSPLEYADPGHAWLWSDGELTPMTHGGSGRFAKLLSPATLRSLRRFAEFGGPLTLPTDAQKSLAQLLVEVDADENTRYLARLLSLSAFVAASPAEVASTEAQAFLQRAALNHVRGGKQAGYPRGGWRRVFEAARSCIEQSGELRLGSPVRRIVLQHGETVGVETDDGLTQASAVVAAVPGQRLHEILDVAALGKEWPRRLREIIPTAGISLDLCLGRRVTDLTGLILSLEPPFFAAFPSNLEPSLAPPGKQLATFFSPIEPERLRDGRVLGQRESDLRKAADAMFPGIFAAVEHERRLVLPIVDGALPMVGQSWEDRPPCRTSIPGLFFAGDWTAGRGAGSDIAFHSAMKAADLVEERLRGL
jgi:phytoene dehydrogenase-like protein